MKHNLALIGCGYWGKNYIKELERVQEAKLKYVYDINKPAVEIPQHIVFTQNINDVIRDKDVRGVIIAIPTKYIFDMTKKFLEAGKDVLMEKPMTESSNEALQLIDLAKRNNSILMVGHVFIHHPAIQKLKAMLDSNELGNIVYIYSQRTAPGPIRNADEIDVLWDLAPHDLSIFFYLLEKEPAAIKGFATSFLRKNIFDAASFSFKLGDTAVEAHVRWLDTEKTRRMIIIGDKKIVVFDDLQQNKLKIYNSRVEFGEKVRIIENGTTIPEINDETPLGMQCRHFIACIENRKEPLTNGESGHKVVKTLEAITRLLKHQKM